jgi:hypothetical protein
MANASLAAGIFRFPPVKILVRVFHAVNAVILYALICERARFS